MSIGPIYTPDGVELPWLEGTHKGPEAYPDIDPVGRKAKWTLTGLADSHRFFHHGVLLATGVNTDLVARFWAENNLPAQEAPYLVEFDRVLFQGLTPPLNHCVFACPTQHARFLFDFLDRASFNRPDGLWHSLHQAMPLVDWRLVDSMAVAPVRPPVVRVELYGLESDSGVYEWKPPKDPWTQPIALAARRKPPKGQKPKRAPFS